MSVRLRTLTWDINVISTSHIFEGIVLNEITLREIDLDHDSDEEERPSINEKSVFELQGLIQHRPNNWTNDQS